MSGQQSLVARLQELKQCLENGLIREEEYSHLRQQMLTTVSTGPAEDGVRSDTKGAAPREQPESSGVAVGRIQSNGGFSLEEAAKFADAEQAAMMKRKPREVLAELQKGNARFWTGETARPEKSAFERRALIGKQFPSVAIIGCADSRVPIELVFDQGLGDIFVIRNAGNTLGTSALASLQYAVEHLKVKLIVIMGHEGCGAVKASLAPVESFSQHPQELGTLLGQIRGGLDAESVNLIRDGRAKDREAVVSNVHYQVARITQDDLIMKKVRNDEVLVTGAFYEISSGIVDFFGEITDATSEKEVKVLKRKSLAPAKFFNVSAKDDSTGGSAKVSVVSSSDDDKGDAKTETDNATLPNLLPGAGSPQPPPTKKKAARFVDAQE